MWQGTFQVKDDKNSILLEAIVVQSLWIWHAIFGLYGRNIDINVLDRSPLVTNFLKGDGQVMSFVVNDHMYPYHCLLIDCIFIPNGLYLYKQFIFPEEKTKNAKMHDSMPRCMSFQTKMWSIGSVFYNQIGNLSKSKSPMELEGHQVYSNGMCNHA